ncbi:unnamed protein product [Rotaria magnacalcarata]|uniref:Uncharacterized protein n=2 Tax=Rotaria magnacalcarata TaxID=392030 RepID=A0A816VZT0_9BILA|nr:unnamed protein product [Rotaria magnacalcarata]CAF1485356.1 unnamed protein product [Rotaria magnacalcarata]CAF1923509.1 unnamed protein product [Rotaria magnacalcarata]CAF2127174.1 unnamed protein product [Rotaria magnacalcarata]CAF3863754.1 unnamed protein product [Rotaria magnacalcarata]
MTTSINYRVTGHITFKGEQPKFCGDEILHISVRDSLRYDIPCIELGSKTILLYRGQQLPIYYQCYYEPNKAHMKFEELKTIPGGVTLSAQIERNDQLLYVNNTDIPLAEYKDIPLVKFE